MMLRYRAIENKEKNAQAITKDSEAKANVGHQTHKSESLQEKKSESQVDTTLQFSAPGMDE